MERFGVCVGRQTTISVYMVRLSFTFSNARSWFADPLVRLAGSVTPGLVVLDTVHVFAKFASCSLLLTCLTLRVQYRAWQVSGCIS